MNYIGRLVTNVRGFYSEINSATLTGAIDIVVIRNEDGSFTGSPFHVRFGKLGVLRSREKIVDIEINGQPVTLQMKLGDAGEAFFVQETDDSVPTSLATSPIPSSHQLETVVDDKKDNRKEDGRSEVQDEEKGRKVETEASPSPQDAKSENDMSRGSPEAEVATGEPSTATQSDGCLENETQSEALEKGQTRSSEDNGEADVSCGQTDNPLEDVAAATAVSAESNNDDGADDLKSESSLSVGSPPKSASIPIPGRRRENTEPSSDAESPWPESGFDDLGHQFYPFSDLDTPVGSPSSGSPEKTRPPSPQKYLSDTEVEINQGDSSLEEGLSWTWGKLPKASKVALQGERKPSDHTRSIDSSHAHKAKRKVALSKISHKVRGEGMYLEDLSSLDHEVAALYLNQALGSRGNHSGTEDHESGIGQSLPCSPSNEEISKEAYGNIAMSLCGELKKGKVAQDQFLQFLVSYEDFCADPSMLSNPKLVIRINDRYFNWQIAAPMLMSQFIFQRPLSQETLKSLVRQHMPKKEKRRSYAYWFTWRATHDDKSSDEEEEDLKKQHQAQYPHQHRARSHSSSGRHQAALAELSHSERPRTVSDCTSGNESDPTSSTHYKKVIRLTSDELASLNLKDGPNTATFSVTTKYQGTASCSATIYLWNYDDKIVISDIDGTITKSDVLGHILPQAGYNWAQSGVAHFFTAIQKNGYKLLYLSARAIGQAQTTRDYLKSVKQDETALPGGPLLLSPESLIKAFHRELIEKKPEEFKIACLRDIQSLFPTRNPFHAGFGNKINDALAYRTVGVSVSRIFTINHKGEVHHELTNTFQSSYLKLSDLVDQMFPAYKTRQGRQPTGGLVAPDEFSSFTYWRPPVEQLSLEEVDDVVGEDEATKP